MIHNRIGSLLFVLVVILFTTGCKNSNNNEQLYAHTNALISETSPYLLKHAHNPVDWKPWSEIAFEEAKTQNKLVLISIGYSSCHWCTVMEEESFSNDTVAKLMNANFINIKVDREERPDVDQVYMTALQLMTGSGGWPLNMILLPNGEPLYGGTYHSKEEWLQTLKNIDSLYKDNPERAIEYADEVTSRIKELNDYSRPNVTSGVISRDSIKKQVLDWQENWDFKYGGNTGSQKFMLPPTLNFLMDFAILNNDQKTLNYLETTLDNIALRGVYDHLGGGFFRYSTDKRWQIPHYEKMLYDNAQLVSLYAKAYKIYKKPVYKSRIVETIAFLNRDMKNAAGVYQAALDADLDGEEGAYYIFSGEELSKAIKTERALFDSYYAIKDQKPSANDEYHLLKNQTDSLFAVVNQISSDKLEDLKKNWNKNLQELRAKRPFPVKDDKIIVSWNALTIEALGDAFFATGNQTYLNQAEATYAELWKKSWKNQTLIHSYKSNSKTVKGFLDDYAFLASASLKLYSITGTEKYLNNAQQLTAKTITDFKVEDSPLFKYNSQDNLISPIVTTNDGVMPSANAVLAKNLFLLSNITYEDSLMDKAKAMILSMSNDITTSPSSFAQWQELQLNLIYPFYDIAIAGSSGGQLAKDLQGFNLPNTLILFTNKESSIPVFEDRWIADKTYIYICEQRSCKFPVQTAAEALKLITY
ncbi:thioredoxin domain-containing protein [Leeuwenhoekiella polynyae]|uniref:Spermatogenesis-associated protein 20-like TRX domain-containing protein n=1 Tax=Leeuwenhoekiella polynyae TaxID=1550906 RepID=A0A4Q0P6E4_9FLAO|nr:thioredoxin domain-containing protein [Leeuwenhoekiella polynyae]RXG22204.1 hypothetical protein DSM02_1803 [Leeuwenhoekiella polynyae]